MKSKGLGFPDNFFDIFGYKRAEVNAVDKWKQFTIIKVKCPSCNQEQDLYILPENVMDGVLYYDECTVCFNGYQYSIKDGVAIELTPCRHE